MKALAIVQTPLALIDVGDYIDYFVDHANAETARKFVLALHRAYDLLASMPNIGSRRDYGEQYRDVRIWTVAEFPKYLIIYTTTEAELRILRVLHGAQDIDTILGDASS